MPDDSTHTNTPAPGSDKATGKDSPAPRQVPETKDSTGAQNPGPHQEHAGERS